MRPEIRRIIAVEAHRQRSGRCPVRIHSLGTGESFEIRPTADGFFDVSSDLRVSASNGHLVLGEAAEGVDLRLVGDVGFAGYDHASNEPFTGRAGGGASVTIYDREGVNFFQYAVVAEGDRT